MVHGAPQCWAFFSFGFEHHYISYFMESSNILISLDFLCLPTLFGHLNHQELYFSHLPPNILWALLIIEDFLSCPQGCLGTLVIKDFFALAPQCRV
jgi:hypothetical protein